MPAASEVPVMGSRRRFTPEYRRDVACLVLDTGSTIASAARVLGALQSWVWVEASRPPAMRSIRSW